MYETIISAGDLQALMNDGSTDIVIVDCRFLLSNEVWGKNEYTQSHIPGAVYAHMNQDLSGVIIKGVTGRHPLPEPASFLSWIQKAGISNQSQIVAYDQGNGGMAARLWWLMRWFGHDAVAVLDGGWPAWQKAGFPTDDTFVHREESTYTPVLRPELVVSVEEVGEWALDPHHLVIDSRESQRYEGLDEHIDPVAGHIPGAINKPYGENNNPDGTWKSPEVLHERFASCQKRSTCDKIAFYCGSGVTASQNVLAFKHAGLGDARLYPGSWSEWITDDEREVETGKREELL